MGFALIIQQNPKDRSHTLASLLGVYKLPGRKSNSPTGIEAAEMKEQSRDWRY